MISCSFQKRKQWDKRRGGINPTTPVHLLVVEKPVRETTTKGDVAKGRKMKNHHRTHHQPAGRCTGLYRSRRKTRFTLVEEMVPLCKFLNFRPTVVNIGSNRESCLVCWMRSLVSESRCNFSCRIEEVLTGMKWRRITDKCDNSWKLKWVECKRNIDYHAFREGKKIWNHLAETERSFVTSFFSTLVLGPVRNKPTGFDVPEEDEGWRWWKTFMRGAFQVTISWRLHVPF